MSPPFQYQPTQFPMATVIPSILEQEGQTQARAIEQAAAARAQGQIAAGQAWGQGLQNLGTLITDYPKIRMQQQQFQMQQQQFQMYQQTRQAMQKASALIAGAVTTNSDGSKTLDPNAVPGLLSQLGPQLPLDVMNEVVKTVGDWNKTIQSFNTETTNHRADMAYALLKSQLGNSPSGIAAAVTLGVLNNMGTPADQQAILDGASKAVAGGGDLQQYLRAMMLRSEKYRDIEKPIEVPQGGTLINPLTNEVVARGGPKQMSLTDLLRDAATVDTADETATARDSLKAVQLRSGTGGGGETALAKDAATLNTDHETPTARDSAAALKLLKPGAQDRVESQMLYRDPQGKLHAGVTFNPSKAPGHQWEWGGQEIDVSRLERPPSAAVLNLQTTKEAMSNLPAWATDASRPPPGAEGNRVDPNIGMTPNGLFQDAMTWIQEGRYPPTGLSNQAAILARRAAIDAKVGAIASDAGMDVPQLRELFRVNAAALKQQQVASDSVQSFMNAADRNAEQLLLPLLKRIPDLNSPLLNRPLRDIDQQALGSVPLAEFRTAIQSVQNEYSRILTQPNLTGQMTDSAREEGKKLIDPNGTAAQILGSIQTLKAEGQNRVLSMGDQIRRIQSRMRIGGGPTIPAGVQTALQGKPPGRYTLRNGSVWVIAADGTIAPGQ